MDKVLILTEDRSASAVLGIILQREHFLLILANSRDAVLANICTLKPDMLIVDFPLTGASSIEVCTQLQICKIGKPMIVLSESTEEIDKVLALEAGADDYVVKPFAPRELVARVRALLRRRKADLSPIVRFGNVEVDRQRRTVMCLGQKVKLTPCEYKLLLFFLGNTDLALTDGVPPVVES